LNVSCEECQSVFRVDPSKVPPAGIRARCSVCGAVIQGGLAPAVRGSAGVEPWNEAERAMRESDAEAAPEPMPVPADQRTPRYTSPVSAPRVVTPPPARPVTPPPTRPATPTPPKNNEPT